jgi:hypothetical protein
MKETFESDCVRFHLWRSDKGPKEDGGIQIGSYTSEIMYGLGFLI